MKPIPLGSESVGCCSPSVGKDCKPEKYYPTAYIELKADKLPSIPTSGTITFVYRMKGLRNQYKEDEVEKASVDLDLLAIVDVTDKDAPGAKTAKDAMAEFIAGCCEDDSDEGDKEED